MEKNFESDTEVKLVYLHIGIEHFSQGRYTLEVLNHIWDIPLP